MKRVPFVDLEAQYQSIRNDIDNAVFEVINQKSFIGSRSNPHVRKFEEAFADYINVNHCVGCANGTDAIEILLEAMGIGAGDEVIVPALTWISTAEAVSRVGATPVFADILPDTYTIDPASIRRRLSENTKAIIPVHLYGMPADMNEIMHIADKHNLLVLEDCAQAHGAKYHGKTVGTFGDAASFSFYPGKNLGAYGDAGAMVSNNSDIAEQARMISQHGQKAKHEHVMEGRNSRLDGLQAAILHVKLPHLDAWTEGRIEAARAYNAAFAGLSIQLPLIPKKDRHVFHLYVINVEEPEELAELLREDGIATARHYPKALTLLEPYREPWSGSCPAAERLCSHILSLPIFAEISADTIEYVADRVTHHLNSKKA